MVSARLSLTRTQILTHRRNANALERRMPPGPGSLRRAAWAGLQDSVPRAAVLSIHARVEETQPSTWEDPSLVQLWGPRYSAYVAAAVDLPVFSLGRLPSGRKGRRRAEELADLLHDKLGGRRIPYGTAGYELGFHGNRLRYAAQTGRVLIRWDGARQPTVWTVPAPSMSPTDARAELLRRNLHVFGPGAPATFSRWAGIPLADARSAIGALVGELLPVRTPIGDRWILAADEASFRAEPDASVGAASGNCGRADARLLPSGDAYFLFHGADRELLVPEADRRAALWTSRVWPGAIFVDGEIVGTWRRADADFTVEPWQPLSPQERDAVVAEAESLPLAGISARMQVRWAA